MRTRHLLNALNDTTPFAPLAHTARRNPSGDHQRTPHHPMMTPLEDPHPRLVQMTETARAVDAWLGIGFAALVALIFVVQMLRWVFPNFLP